MENYNITVGEDFSLIVSLKTRDGLAYTGANGGSVSAYLVDRRQAGTLNGSKVAQADSGNADWAAGTVEVVFADTDTAGFSVGRYYLRLDITTSGGDIKKIISEDVFQVWSET